MNDTNERTVVLADDPAAPRLLIARHQGSLMAIGDPAGFPQAARDLFARDVRQQPPWNPAQYRDTTLEVPERAGLFCNSAPLALWEALRDAGFEVDAEDKHHAYTWYLTGEPRFGEQVKHPCRLGAGLELHSLLRQGIGYDQEGSYTEKCLLHGPSFVCEVDGVPVCWAATHLSGTMGMIYTPDEHRRRGYARSLAAFQIDHTLQHDGLACCHIVSTNTASMELVRGFGFTQVQRPIVWRMVCWPEGTFD